MFRAVFPEEISLHILSFLDVRSLGRAQCVCKEWRELAGDDQLWRGLLRRLHQQTPPLGGSGKEALFRAGVLEVSGSEDELRRVMTIFFCTLKWNVHRRLECQFTEAPNAFLALEQRFGYPGMEKAHETERCRYTGPLSPGWSSSEEVTHVVPSNVPYGLPVRTVVTLGPGTSLPLAYLLKGEEAFSVEVYDVNLPPGYTLGYGSSINAWSPLFFLTRVQINDEAPAWVGRIPYSHFKFAKMSPTGQVTWETGVENNRFWSLQSWGGAYDSFARVLQDLPISFQER
jgi:hypothetical protein